MSKSKKSREKAAKKRRQKMKKAKEARKSAPAIIIPGTKGAGIIEEIWAEMGVVKVRTSAGIVKSMTWKDAAHRAAQLNAAVPDLPHATTKQQYLGLIDKIIKAVRQARAQQETPDKKTEGLHNLLSGKNEDGSAVNIGKIEDYLVDDYRKRYPTLDEDEIVLILREDVKWPTIKEKETVMHTLNAARTKAAGEAAEGGVVLT